MLKKLNKNSETVLKERYYLKDDKGRVIETWPDLCHRVVNAVVPEERLIETYKYTEKEAKKIKEQIFQMINELYFLPNSPTLFASGTRLPMLSACFIVDMEDSLDGIYETIKEAAIIQQYGGGIGCDFSKLRGKGSKISTTNGKSTGAVSFLRALSSAVMEIEQGGRRRGAGMAILRADHPDIYEFINAKKEEGAIHNFNLSVGIPDAFIEAVEQDTTWDLVDPHGKKAVKSVKARELMRDIANDGWSNGEPGVVFVDKVNEDNPTPHLGDIRSSNPCQPGWATLKTFDGITTFEKINVGDIIWSGQQWTKIIRKEMTGVKPVYAYRTAVGTFFGTENHRVVQRREKIEVCRATHIDACPPLTVPPNELPDLWKSFDNTYPILDRTYCCDTKVYSITVDAPEHTYWTDGLLVSNCGEFYNIPYNSCNLGSINLSLLVENGKFSWSKFKKRIQTATLFLDCVIEACKYPLDKIDQTTKKTRPVGLGVMGFADALIKLGLKYDSNKARKFAENIAEVMGLSSLEESVALSKRAGSYPEFRVENHKYEKYLKFSARRKNLWKSLVRDIAEHGLRNSHTTVLAPTGTLARIANEVSFGIEPVFAFEFSSNILGGKSLEYRHQLYKAHKNGELNVDPSVFVSAKDILPEDHIKMQAAFQKYIHSGISKTINLPNEAAKEQVYDLYLLAHKLGLKGLTIYREGSRQVEVLVDKDRKKQRGRPAIDINKDVLQKLVEQEKMTVQKLSDIYDCSVSTIHARLREYGIKAINKPERMRLPDEISARRFKLETDLGSLYVMVGVDEVGRPIEIIMNVGRSGATLNALAEGLGKVISIALQCGLEVGDIVKTLEGIGGEDATFWRGKLVKSIPDFVAQVLKENYMDSIERKKIPAPKKSLSQTKCPICGEEVLFQEGCLVCSSNSCSYSKCGG